MKTNISKKISIFIGNVFLLFFLFYKSPINDKTLNYRLNKDKLKRIPKYILLMDFYPNPFCNDLNAYYIFKYYQKNNNNNAYYIINCKSDLYQYLTKQNQTQNLIPVDSNDNIVEKLYNIYIE